MLMALPGRQGLQVAMTAADVSVPEPELTGPGRQGTEGAVRAGGEVAQGEGRCGPDNTGESLDR